MTELRQALGQISAIRTQVARGTQFRGYGPRSITAGGVLALMVAALQARSSSVWGHGSAGFVAVWVTTAGVAVSLAVWETIFRARRVHAGFAKNMMHAAAEQFLPAVVVGILLTVVLLTVAPQVAWMLPGLWQLAFCLGIFASCRFLPRPTFIAGLWYLACGLTSLVLASSAQTLLPWTMGIPFGVGQLLVAVALQYGYEDFLEER